MFKTFKNNLIYMLNSIAFDIYSVHNHLEEKVFERVRKIGLGFNSIS